MPDLAFRFVSSPGAFGGAPRGWAAEMLRDGEISLLPDEHGLDGVNEVAHSLDAATISLVRVERTAEAQERTVMDYAGGLPLVWIAPSFGSEATAWAKRRGPMTLLVEASGGVSESDRGRIDRFVAFLGRQAE